MDYIKRSKKAEAALQLEKVGRNAKRTYGETGGFPAGSTGPTPARPGLGGCCGGSGARPNHCAGAPSAWTGAWKALDFEIDEDNRVLLQLRRSHAELHHAVAIGDLDCDGIEIHVHAERRLGERQPTATLSEPPTNAD